MSAAPPAQLGLEQAFHLAAGELGMCSAAWNFVGEVHAELGEAGVRALRDELGRTYPVLDSVAAQHLEGRAAPTVDIAPVLRVLQGASAVLVVGVETRFLDPLLRALRGPRVALLRRSPFPVDWERLASNYEGLELVDLDRFQALGGPRSALLTFAYGVHGQLTHVPSGWLRILGEDVRTQFRVLAGWEVLGTPMYVFPRWLLETPIDGFTHFISGGARR